jgi:hypothetical protein
MTGNLLWYAQPSDASHALPRAIVPRDNDKWATITVPPLMLEALIFLSSCVIINIVQIMGANQSRPSDAAVNDRLRERLQALHMNEDRAMSEKDGFVHVAGDARMALKDNITEDDL